MSFPIHIVTVPSHIMLGGLLIKNKSSQFKTLPTLDQNVSILRFETEMNRIFSFPKKNVAIIYMYYRLFLKKKQRMRTWNFQGYWRAYENFRDQVKEWSFHLIKKKIMWNFHGSWFLVLKFPRVVAQFCGISWVETLLSPEFPRIKWQT